MWPDQTALSFEGLRRTPEQSRSQEKVNLVVDAAEALLRTAGYAETVSSPRALIEAAGVTKGTFYTYFENPEAVMHHLAVRMLDRACRLADELAEEPFTTVDDVVDGLVDRFTKFYRDRAVQEIWLYHPYEVNAEALNEAANAYIMGRVTALLEKVSPGRATWSRVASAVAGHVVDHLMQYAFRLDAGGDPEVLTETKRLLRMYVEATFAPGSRH